VPGSAGAVGPVRRNPSLVVSATVALQVVAQAILVTGVRFIGRRTPVAFDYPRTCKVAPPPRNLNERPPADAPDGCTEGLDTAQMGFFTDFSWGVLENFIAGVRSNTV
jgi:hypothetical protein